MSIPTNQEIYDAEYRASNFNVSTRQIALNAMFTLRTLLTEKPEEEPEDESDTDKDNDDIFAKLK